VLERESKVLLLLRRHVFLLQKGSIKRCEEVTSDDEAADPGDNLEKEGGREGGRGGWARF